MAYSSKEIIAGVLKIAPQTPIPEIRNCADSNLESKIRYINQYILGLTDENKFNSGVDHYENRLKERISKLTQTFRCLAWRFTEFETEEMKTALSEIATHFNIEIDIPKMLANIKVQKDFGTNYYIVVTVVQYPIMYCSQNK